MDKTPKGKISAAGKSEDKGVPWVEGGKKAIQVAAYTANLTGKMQNLEGSIIAVSRSFDEGKVNVEFLKKEINELGLNVESAYENYRIFTKAMMGTSLQGEKANKIFRQVTEASVVMHASTEESKAAFIALSNMMRNGTVQAGDLTGELQVWQNKCQLLH